MKVMICGAGIAGLTLALCLEREGHDPVLVEKSPSLRDEGYMIDFLGSGYDAAERMGLVPDLEKLHYSIPRLVFVDSCGKEHVSIPYATVRRLLNGRHFNFMRGDLERLLFEKVRARIRFGTTVDAYQDCGSHVRVTLSDGSSGSFDLLVGADGIHSRIRELAFGPEAQFLKSLGYNASAFILSHAPESFIQRDAFYTLTVPGRQAGIYPIRGDRLATFFLYQTTRAADNFSFEAIVRELRTVYADMDWIIPLILERCDRSTLYFDAVSQIEMPHWSRGRVVLVGDACQCVSLVAGQGASLAMAGAFILCQELMRNQENVPSALANYESRLKPHVESKQKAGRKLARWFLPDNKVRLVLRNMLMRMTAWPVASQLVRRSLAPESVFQSEGGRELSRPDPARRDGQKSGDGGPGRQY